MRCVNAEQTCERVAPTLTLAVELLGQIGGFTIPNLGTDSQQPDLSHQVTIEDGIESAIRLIKPPEIPDFNSLRNISLNPSRRRAYVKAFDAIMKLDDGMQDIPLTGDVGDAISKRYLQWRKEVELILAKVTKIFAGEPSTPFCWSEVDHFVTHWQGDNLLDRLEGTSQAMKDMVSSSKQLFEEMGDYSSYRKLQIYRKYLLGVVNRMNQVTGDGVGPVVAIPFSLYEAGSEESLDYLKKNLYDMHYMIHGDDEGSEKDKMYIAKIYSAEARLGTAIGARDVVETILRNRAKLAVELGTLANFSEDTEIDLETKLAVCEQEANRLRQEANTAESRVRELKSRVAEGKARTESTKRGYLAYKEEQTTVRAEAQGVIDHCQAIEATFSRLNVL